jgi:hypothetical protein
VILKHVDVQHRYYIRSGSDFVPATHSQLEDMFGRRPRPKLAAKVRGDFRATQDAGWWIAFDVVNEGRGTAKQVYIEFLDRSEMSRDSFNKEWHVFSARDLKTGQRKIVFELAPTRAIHPGMAIEFDGLKLQFSEHFLPGKYVQLPCTLYCEGCAPVQTIIEGILQPIRNS